MITCRFRPAHLLAQLAVDRIDVAVLVPLGEDGVHGAPPRSHRPRFCERETRAGRQWRRSPVAPGECAPCIDRASADGEAFFGGLPAAGGG